ncbi:helix-turn-helix domain-containing protein [Streptomyces chartreusis]
MPAIADELRRSPETVRCWLHCFNQSGLDGPEVRFPHPTAA